MYRFIWLLLTPLLISGCGVIPVYPIGKENFTSRQEAVASMQPMKSRIEAELMPAPQRIGGVLVLAYPKREWLDKFFQDWRAGYSLLLGVDSADFVFDMKELDVELTLIGIQRGSLFDEATLVRTDDNDQEPPGNWDYKLGQVFNPGDGMGTWRLQRKSDGRIQTIAVASEPKVMKDLRTYEGFNDRVLKAAQSLGVTLLPQFSSPSKVNSPRVDKSSARKGSLIIYK